MSNLRFSTIFDLSGNTFWPQASGFQKLSKLAFFGIFNELLSTQNVNVARFARNVLWDNFCDFQTLCFIMESWGEKGAIFDFMQFCTLTCLSVCLFLRLFGDFLTFCHSVWNKLENISFLAIFCVSFSCWCTISKLKTSMICPWWF